MTQTDQLQRVIAAINENSVALPDAACVQVTVGDLRSLIAHSEELLKIAAQVGEPKDPFAVWETIARLMGEKAPGHTDLMLSSEDIDEALEKVGYLEDASFQGRVAKWMMECFGADITNSLQERCFRFAEESGELVQALGMTEAQWQEIGAYVWSRPVGEVGQEVGGVMVTLAAACHAANASLDHSAETELARVNTPEMIDKIRRKHNDKKLRIPQSALPGSVTDAPPLTIHQQAD